MWAKENKPQLAILLGGTGETPLLIQKLIHIGAIAGRQGNVEKT